MEKSSETSAAAGAADGTGIRRVVATGVTKPLELYSHATVHAGLVYLSGVQGFVPGTFTFPGTDAGAQAAQALKNARHILEQCGSDLSHVVRATLFLVEMSDFPAVNAEFNAVFPHDPPARSTLAVKELPRGARVIFEFIAAVRG